MIGARGDHQSGALTTNLALLGWSGLILLAEILTVVINARLGLWLHAAIMGTLLLLASREGSRPLQRVYLSLAFAPLIRIISLSSPLIGLPLMYWYLLTGIPLAVAVAVALRLLRLPRHDVGLTVRWSPDQLLVGVSGFGLGYLEYLILRPAALAPADDAVAIMVAALILVIFTGLLEEVIFRGLMQGTAERVLGARGIIFVAIVFTILHLGYRSILDLLFVFAVALYFGFYVHRTRSIFGVSLAHAMVNVSLFLIFPHWIGPSEAAAIPRLTPTATPEYFLAATVWRTPTPFLPMEASPTSVPTATSSPTASPTPTATPTAIVVDDPEGDFWALDGRWWRDPLAYDGELHWAFSVPGVPSAQMEWRVDLPTCGRYLLEIYLPVRYSSAREATYLVVHSAGESRVTIDQFARRGGWAALGVFSFGPGPSVLRLDNVVGGGQSGQLVAFDAARWTYVGACRSLSR